MRVDDFLGQLKGVRPSGGGWTARCPAHQDRNASLSVGLGDEDRVLLECHAGCTVGDIVAVLGLSFADLFDCKEGGGSIPVRPRATMQQCRGLTLAAYAEAKRLPVEFLRSLDVGDVKYLGADAVRIPYVDGEGNVLAARFRLALAGADRFRWKKGSKPPLYGLNRMGEAREAGYVVLVEGESDAQTLWHAGFPAVRLPGANGWREDRDAPLLEPLPVYVVVEQDRSGEAVLRWLSASAIRDRLRLVTLGEAHDVSELYLADPETFAERFEQALQSATPWEQRQRVQAELLARDAWGRCAELARIPRILDRFGGDVARHGLAGEQKTAQTLYLTLTSRLLDHPVRAGVKGPSAAGKSYAVQKVSEFFPESAFYALTAMSERALAYGTEPLAHRHLILYEAGGFEGELASYLVRSLLSEGRVRYETVEKTAGGLQSRLIEREGPTGLIVTTTKVALHPENETRLLSLPVTDTTEQTKNVLLALVEDREPVDLEPWHALQEWLAVSEHRIVIPYARTLAELVPPIAVRLRRDFGALLNLIRAHALLHQASPDRDEQGRVVATSEDYAVVRELVHDFLSEGVEATVPPTVRETVEAVAELVGEEGVTVTELAKILRVDKSAASRRWQTARARGFLRNLETGRGKAARLVTADPLPNDVDVLPPVELLADVHHRCTVARNPGGSGPPGVIAPEDSANG